jgi:dTDP-4-amino-4,6-dideoxygalactose transaminase
VVALERFPKQFAQRAQMANYLEESLSEVPGIQLLKRDLRLTRRSLYRYVIKMDPEYYHCNHDMFCKALSAEGIPVDTGYPAMHRYELFQPRLSKLPVPTAFPEYFDFENMSLPITERASEKESVWMGEAIFRAGQEGIDDIIKGIQKLAENKSVLEKISRS